MYTFCFFCAYIFGVCILAHSAPAQRRIHELGRAFPTFSLSFLDMCWVFCVFLRFVMGKFKSKRSGGVKPSRNVPLSEQLLEEKAVRPPGREKQRRRREDDDDVCSFCGFWLFRPFAVFRPRADSPVARSSPLPGWFAAWLVCPWLFCR